MVRFTDLFSQAPLVPPPSAVATNDGAAPSQVPPGVQQFAGMLEAIMPTVEQITGLTRRDIFLQLLKTGFKGGGIESIINGLMGKQQQPDVKFVRYVKTLAIWVPVAVFLFGLAIVSIILFAKLIIMVMGGL